MGKELFNPHPRLVFYSETKRGCLLCALVYLGSIGSDVSG